MKTRLLSNFTQKILNDALANAIRLPTFRKVSRAHTLMFMFKFPHKFWSVHVIHSSAIILRMARVS